METQKALLDQLTVLRKHIHKFPEIAGSERDTVKKIQYVINNLKPDRVLHTLGGYGVAFVFDSAQKGPTVMIRCELDAQQINESNSFEHRSLNKGMSHKSGNDGHMCIVTGLAFMLSQFRPISGNVVLLFQPSTDTGLGANLVMKDPKFPWIKPDYIFGIKNLPGFPKNDILLKKDSFCGASVGMIVRLRGKSCLAAQPFDGLNPDKAVAELIKAYHGLLVSSTTYKDKVGMNIVRVQLGTFSFNISPGNAEILVSLRSILSEDLEVLKLNMSNKTQEVSRAQNVEFEIRWEQHVDSTINNADCLKYIRDSADLNKYNVVDMDEAFLWSDDFGNYTKHFKGALFGIGAGEDQLPLNDPEYDFPDELIEGGIKVFYGIIDNILHLKT